jgi:hypothetical protein
LAFLAFFLGCGIFGLVQITHGITVQPKLMGMTTTFRHLARAVPALLLAAALAPHGAAQAQTAIYKCVDAQGRVEFTDTNKRGCKALDLPGFIEAPPARSAPPATRQGSAPPRAASPVTPANFPRVDGAQQRARDDDRRGILNEELRAEEKKLGELKAEFNNGEPERQGNERNYAKYQERVARLREDVGRTERNIEALKREIANIR